MSGRNKIPRWLETAEERADREIIWITVGVIIGEIIAGLLAYYIVGGGR